MAEVYDKEIFISLYASLDPGVNKSITMKSAVISNRCAACCASETYLRQKEDGNLLVWEMSFSSIDEIVLCKVQRRRSSVPAVRHQRMTSFQPTPQ